MADEYEGVAGGYKLLWEWRCVGAGFDVTACSGESKEECRRTEQHHPN